MEFFGIEVPASSMKSDAADMRRFLDALCPKPSPAPLLRIGPRRDGSYLVPDDLLGVTACFSPGVNNFKSFEDELAERFDIAAHLCDASSDVELFHTPLIDGVQTFEKLWLDVPDSENAVSLDTWVARHRPDAAEDLMLQMDIEGAEFRNILATSEETLKRFRIVVLELHSIERMDHQGVLQHVLLPFVEKLGRHFTCVHAHPNNVTGPVRFADLGTAVPSLIEVTLLRNDRFNGRALHPPQLPHALDIKYNVRNRPPLFLDDYFRGRPPSLAEKIRMGLATARFHWQRFSEPIKDFKRGLQGKNLSGK